MVAPGRRILRIVSWNIRAGGGRRVELIAKHLTTWRADVVALSEFRGTRPSGLLKDTLAAAGLCYQASTTDLRAPAANSLLVGSRWRMRMIRARSQPREPGRWCLAAIGCERPFTLGAMHVPNRVSGRKYPYLDAVLQLTRCWRRGPGLLIGDTNSGRIGIDEEVPAFNKREDRWVTALDRHGWHDSFRHLHGDARAYTWYSPNGRNGFRIDQAFVNRKLLPRLVDSRYEWARLDAGDRDDAVSDHAALIVDLEP
jgi:exonuclease III